MNYLSNKDFHNGSDVRKAQSLRILSNFKDLGDVFKAEEPKSEEVKDPKADLKRAEKVDLITLPESVKGTNCGNCKFVDPDKDWCTNKQVVQPVNNRMCCALWDSNGVKRAWEVKKNIDPIDFT